MNKGKMSDNEKAKFLRQMNNGRRMTGLKPTRAKKS
tara:strand:+ start:396 stop:503 length:108 start_codon:yes stop_codon:yes gene_type:complete